MTLRSPGCPTLIGTAIRATPSVILSASSESTKVTAEALFNLGLVIIWLCRVLSDGSGGSGLESHVFIDISVAGVMIGVLSMLKVKGDPRCFRSDSPNEPAMESSSIKELLKALSQSFAMLLLK